MQQLSFEYPAWFILFCLLAGLAYALTLYYRDQTFREQPTWLRASMAVLRFVAVSLIAILLLSPLIRYLRTDEQQPIVVVAQDVSESVGTELGADTTAYRAAFAELTASLAADYQLETYTFSDDVTATDELDFRGKRTNISQVFQEVYDRYSNQNLGAVILATDGIYNAGSNPVYRNNQLNVPVYTVALGDTTLRRDLVLRRVFHNRIAYLNDRFSVQVDIGARNAAGSRSLLTVDRVASNGTTQRLSETPIAIDSEDFFTTRELILDAQATGVQRFRLRLQAIPEEASISNNVRDIFVDVLDARKQILILAHAPHPDLSALRQSLESGQNNEVAVAYANRFVGSVADYDLVILHQLPSNRYDISNVTNQLAAENIPTWYIVGEETNTNRLNELQSLLNIRVTAQATNDVQANLAPDFSLFTLSDELRAFLPSLPPVVSPFGNFNLGAGGTPVLYQKIGRIDSDYPLLVLGEVRGRRTGVFAATGLWQWRLFDFLEHQNHDRFNELVSQITQYLSVKEDKRRFRVIPAENIFDENEPVLLDAELYNDNYELINEPDVTVTITDADGNDYDYTFNRQGRAYTLDAGVLPVGSYRYRAETNTGTETLTYQGQFSIQPIQVERYETTADHDLLRLLSDRSGGQLVFPDQLGTLPQLLAERGTVKPVLYQTVTTRSVINLKWLFALLALLLAAEWFLRRYFGAY
jgi:hypothetical protein